MSDGAAVKKFMQWKRKTPRDCIDAIQTQAPAATPVRQHGTQGVLYRCGLGESARVTFMSPGSRELTGFGEEAFVGESVGKYRGLIHPDDRPGYIRELLQSLRHSESYTTHYRLNRPDGQTVVVRERGTILRGEDGQPCGIEAQLIDITTQALLQEEKKAYETISSEYRCTLDSDGFIADASQTLRQLLGWTLAELTAKPLTEFIHFEDKADCTVVIQNLFRGSAVANWSFRMLRSDGTFRALSWDVAPRPEFGRMFAVVKDLSDECGTEGEAERFRSMVEHCPEEFYLCLPDGVITYCNAAAASSLGVPSREVVGLNILQLNGAELDASSLARFQLPSGSATGMFETEHLHRNGLLVPKRLRIFSLTFDGDEIICAVGHSIEQELQDRNALIESERAFRMLADNARDLIYRFTAHPAPSLDYINPVCEEFTGYSREELYADPLLAMTLIHPEDREKLRNLGPASGSSAAPIVLRIVRKDRQIVNSEHHLRLILDRTGKTGVVEGIARNLSQKPLKPVTTVNAIGWGVPCWSLTT